MTDTKGAIKKQPKSEQPKMCRGNMCWADDGNAFQCDRCGYTVQRTRMNPMPDTDHLARKAP